MPEKTKLFDIGVIVARFQVDQLHDGHFSLIEQVQELCKIVIIGLGVKQGAPTDKDPLDFYARRQMITDKYKNMIVIPITDHRMDVDWTNNLDQSIQTYVLPGQKVCLFGARDSFLKYYTGKFDTREMPSIPHISGAEIRKEISQTQEYSPSQRKALIRYHANRFPIVYSTVDIGIVREDSLGTFLLLCRKSLNQKWSFVGGFVEKGQTLEQTAIREVSEETGLEVCTPKYICSRPIDDWRYKNTKDGIVTTLFCCQYISGSPKAADDIMECKFFSISNSEDIQELRAKVADNHLELYDELIGYILERM